ncbi:mitotic deacetylase-associated SANT domain protein-like [Nerophis ophidion]|uniref:mitotic deacetylase-associated SANT domain protein-like n=1 Tax=Nerophis ophidion TaxID=159077 RepID=UPI002AE0240E|nr:mitotic deacetylase-associated SANT domain protein-like [Nerophis ophidion]
MLAMSVPAPQKPGAKRTGKRITFFSDQAAAAAMKEGPQQPEGAYYVQAGAASAPGKVALASGAASNPDAPPHVYLNSVIFSPDKGDQNRGHYQQTVPMKWPQQEPDRQQPSLSQHQRSTTWTTMANWGQTFANYLGGVNVTDSRNQAAFGKAAQETSKARDVYREAAEARNLEWEQQQVFQETLKPGALNPQPSNASQQGGNSVLQPFQLAFGQPRQHLPAYYQTFQGNTRLPNPPNYSVQDKPPKQLKRDRLIQQQLQQQQRLQLQQQQMVQQQKMKQQQMQHQQLQQQSSHVLDCYPPAPNTHPHPQPVVLLSQECSTSAPPNNIPEPIIQDVTPDPWQPSDPPLLSQAPLLPDPFSQAQLPPDTLSQTQLRRSRRLSKEGGAPSDSDPFLAACDQAAPGMRVPHNGTRDVPAAPTGVIQSTHRKRRVSQEVNLETLAQKASEMETLPSHGVKEANRPWTSSQQGSNTKRPRDDSLLPLVIPVSVPVCPLDPSEPDRDGAAVASVWPPRPTDPPELGGAERKPSVIVTRRRSLRNSPSESSEQNGGVDCERDDDAKRVKRRPRPEPLFIPPPKLGVFIAPPLYSSITPYQSHLRSPVRPADNAMPPYTPPPILSPVREGSGLYFSTFLSSAGGLAPPATPKSATRSLLRSSSCDMTPPVLCAMTEVTPVSMEP